MYFNYFPTHFLLIFLYGKLLTSSVYVIIYCVGAGITTLMSIFDGLDPYFSLSKDGKDKVCEGRNGRKGVYFPQKSAFFPFINNMIKVLFPICTLIWRVNIYVCRQGKVKVGEMKVLFLLYKL